MLGKVQTIKTIHNRDYQWRTLFYVSVFKPVLNRPTSHAETCNWKQWL